MCHSEIFEIQRQGIVKEDREGKKDILHTR